ncbi:MAG: polysaccharide biosynthesis tyrosine autokinase [Muribaculaceae bacterium]|nr:polysaccharide biosynthesis tyrosine autokinase [Muribaculaceae bacterium]
MSNNSQENTNPATTSAQGEKMIDMGSVYNKYKRFWWLFVLSLIACIGLSVLFLKYKLPKYLVISTVLVDQDDDAGSTGASLLKSLSIGGGGASVDDEVVVMGSQDICNKMVKELKINRLYTLRKSMLDREDLYKNSPIEIDAPDEVFDTLSIGMNFKVTIKEDGKTDIKVKKGRFKTLAELKDQTLPVNVSTKYGTYQVRATEFYKPGEETVVNASVTGNQLRTEYLMEDMTVKVLNKKSNAIYMDVETPNIKRGKDMLNTMIRLYNERGQREKDEQAINTAKFIEDRLGLIYKDLTGSEAEIEAYKQAHNMADVGIQTKASIARQEQADNKIVALEAQYRIVSLINEFISDPRNHHSYIPFEADSTAASGSIRAFNQLAMKRAELAKSAKDGNEALQEIDNQLDAMRETIRKGVNNTLNALKIQIDKASQVSNESQGEMSQVPTQEREIRSLYREQGIQNALYTFLLQKREENALVLAATTPKGKIVDNAYAQSKPVSPNVPVVLLIGLIAGLMLPVLLLYLKNLFTTKFSTQDELQNITKSPVLGEICHNRHRSSLVVKPGKTSSIVELFRLLRNNVQFLMTRKEDKVVLVTSSISGEGKSFVSTNLASSFALLGKKVVLVGMDIRNPQLAKMLNIKDLPGVTNYLSNSDLSIDEIAQKVPEVENLNVIVAGPIPPNPSELLLGERTTQFFDQLRERYDIVIIDSAPIAMVSDTFSLAKFGDATLFVTRANYTKRNLVKYFNEVVARKQFHNAAVVLNDSNPRLSAGYGYGYGKEKK